MATEARRNRERARKKRKLKEKRSSEEIALAALSKHNRDKKSSIASSKKKTFEEVIDYLDEMYKHDLCIRSPKEWKPSSYNFNKQVISFIKWIYCEYNVPSFMFGIFDRNNRLYHGGHTYHNVQIPGRRNRVRQRSADFDSFFEWFMLIASGKSFAKALSDLFTKKEAHIFLNGPPNLNIYENYWRAKIVAAGGSEKLVNMCLRRFPNNSRRIKTHQYWYDAAKFFPRFEKEIDLTSVVDVMDYIVDTAFNNNNKFSFKGKTFSSIIKASNTWHKEQQLKKFGDLNVYFPLCSIDPWKWKDKREKCDWVVRQILNAKHLYREGKTMHHCVASYTHACKEGRSFIFSMTMEDGVNIPERVLTIELNRDLALMQARGKCNASPSGMASKVLNKWMSENNVKQNDAYWW